MIHWLGKCPGEIHALYINMYLSTHTTHLYTHNTHTHTHTHTHIHTHTHTHTERDTDTYTHTHTHNNLNLCNSRAMQVHVVVLGKEPEQCCQATRFFCFVTDCGHKIPHPKKVCLLTEFSPLNIRSFFKTFFCLIISSLMLDPLNHCYFTLLCYVANILTIKGKAVRGVHINAALSHSHTHTTTTTITTTKYMPPPPPLH